jgi:hypothetical protein
MSISTSHGGNDEPRHPVASGTSGTLACPLCGSEYEGWSSRCPTCGVALVPAGDAPNPLELSEDEQVVYELGEWSLDLQASAAQAMAESGVPHAWDGTDLVVHLDHEAQVDVILAEVEREAGIVDEAAEGDETGEVLFDLSEWTADQRGALGTALDEGDVPHRWEDETTLVVADVDEELTEQLLDTIEFPDALPPEEPSPEVEAADEARAELLSELFLSADRLKSDVNDASAYESLLLATEEADAGVPPYGFDPRVWAVAVEQANVLADLIASEDDRSDEAEAQAKLLRDLLRPYV